MSSKIYTGPHVIGSEKSSPRRSTLFGGSSGFKHPDVRISEALPVAESERYCNDHRRKFRTFDNLAERIQ